MRHLSLAVTVLVLAIAAQKAARAVEPISTSIGLLLEAPSAIKLVGEYLGIIESLESKTERLLDADMKTAVSLFEQAQANQQQAGELIKDARIYFTRAAAIQDNSMDEGRRHKRALALLGLWACCEATSDQPNAKLAMKKIMEIPSTPSAGMVTKYMAWNHPTVKRWTGRSFSLLPRLLPELPPTPTVQELRAFNKDYDQLIAIQIAVKEKSQ
jgi:hypothetical protein